MRIAPYPAPEIRERELADLVTRARATIPGVELIEYGRSVEQRALQVLRVPQRATGNSAPTRRVLVCANTHGPEFIGNQVCTALLAKLVDDPPAPLRQLHERAELWLAPCLNPDGYARTYALDGHGTLPQLRHNHHGVDLNRNWPLPPGARRLPLPGTGSPTPGDATYRGPAPLSEPETAALDQLLTQQGFHASANLHSFMGTLFPPRIHTHEDASAYKRLCTALRQAQPHTRYLRIASRLFDTFTGEQEDHQHHAHRCWSVCVECFSLRASLSQSFGRRVPLFWRFNPRDPQPWIDNDVPGVAAFLLAALELPRPGSSVARAKP